MKLYYSATSPYVRKVMACAITRGLEGRIQLHPANPHASPADLVADNPTSKVPCPGSPTTGWRRLYDIQPGDL